MAGNTRRKVSGKIVTGWQGSCKPAGDPSWSAGSPSVKKSKKLQKVLVLLSLAALAPARQALADSPAPTGGAPTSAEVSKEGPPRFGGFSLDYSIYDGSGLNNTNYSNSITQYFEPSWSPGKLWLRGTRFKTLTLAG